MQNCQGSVYTVIAITFERFSNLRTSGRHSKVTNDAISKKQNESDIKLEIEKGKKTSSSYFSAQNLFKLASRPYSVNDLIGPHHLKHFTNKLSLRFNRLADWLTASYFPFGYWNREFSEPFCTYLYVARKGAQKSCMETDVVDLVPSIFIFIGPNPNHCLPSSLTDVVKLNWCDSGLWG